MSPPQEEELKEKLVLPVKAVTKGFSPSFKYAELLKRELPLPPHFKELMVLFQSLDQIILAQRHRKKTSSLSLISKLMNLHKHCDFHEKTLRQIFFIAPDFFTHYWHRNQARDPIQPGGELELCIDFATTMIDDILKAETLTHHAAPNACELEKLPLRIAIPHSIFQ